MKFKMKMLAAAMTLAVAGTANAAIDTMASGDGSMFLSIRDNTNNKSIVLDLNTPVSTFAPGSTAALGSFDVSNVDVQNFVAAAGGASANLSWAVMGGDAVGNTLVHGINYLSTSQADATSIPVQNQVLNNFQLEDTSYIANVNSLIGANDTLVSANGDAAYFSTDNDSWQFNTSWSTTAGVDQSMNFFLLQNSASVSSFTGKTKIADVTQYAGAFSLDNTGVLHYSAVPVPPAIWLLGSALMGLVGVARRKSQNA